MSYKEDLKVNRYILDDLWEEHQDIYMEYAEDYADATKSRNDAKELLDYKKAQAKDTLALVQSKLDNEIRSNPIKYGYEKLTEQIVNSWIIRQEEYQTALLNLRKIVHKHALKLNEEEYRVDLLKGVKESFEHRKTSMDNLTRLMIGGYYSSKPAKDVGKIVKKSHQERIESTMHEGLKESFRRRGRPRKESYGEKS